MHAYVPIRINLNQKRYSFLPSGIPDNKQLVLARAVHCNASCIYLV